MDDFKFENGNLIKYTGLGKKVVNGIHFVSL